MRYPDQNAIKPIKIKKKLEISRAGRKFHENGLSVSQYYRLIGQTQSTHRK